MERGKSLLQVSGEILSFQVRLRRVSLVAMLGNINLGKVKLVKAYLRRFLLVVEFWEINLREVKLG